MTDTKPCPKCGEEMQYVDAITMYREAMRDAMDDAKEAG